MAEEKGTVKPVEGKGSVSAPTISLPKGGGAIRGMGEKFAANPVTGTGSMTVPIATSPGRQGFGPQLSLSYDSGSGNGPFGFGWTLSVPAITRKTDQGLPQYQDAAESDVFILSGAEDLVPVLNPDGSRFADTAAAAGYVIHRFQPRIEEPFARIERWTRQSDGDVHWRSISRDNILTLYGKDPNGRIADPTDPKRIFSWLICETRDDKGDAVLYTYKSDDGVGVQLNRAHERNRGGPNDPRRTANRYLKRIQYGNRVPLLDNAGRRPRQLTAAQVQSADWMFEVVFDYGEHDADAPKPQDVGEWTHRVDPFSSYRSGFEVRTSRLCQRVLMFHHFAGEAEVGVDCLVRSTDLTYSGEQDPSNVRNPVYTFLRAVTQTGYRRDNGGYLKRSLPPVEYEYSQPIVQDTVQEVDAASLENLPIGLDGTTYQWTDLHGEGIPGILTEQAGGWFYKRNISPVSERPVEFAAVECVATKPNLSLGSGKAQFLDLAGDGQPDLVVLDGPTPGLYEHDDAESWQPFRPFNARLNRDTSDPNLKFVDLDGDGHADVLISEDDAFVWHRSLAEAGFGPAQRVHLALDEEQGPRLVFADETQSVYLADLSGDGLTDLLRIRNGEVCYWPNLGYGRFGAKVTMDDAPHLDSPDQFDHRRIRLADIDGSGTTDLIYLHHDGARLYFNQSGNSWSASQRLGAFPRVDDLAAVTATDLMGNGTACLVWSSPLPGSARRPMRYVDLMGGRKPHLLVKTVNNLGAEIRVQYASSTVFYLRDRYAGTPWITRLAFPVHVVERVETLDTISGNRFVTRYAYHHGYFDGEEREFRGFGMVEQWDTEEFAVLNEDLASHVPPVLTRTWFHTGLYIGREHVSDFFATGLNASHPGEYYREPGLTDAQARLRLLPDTVMPPGLTLAEEREACRALKGVMLRQEVYARDQTVRADTPYTIAEQNFTIECVQDRHHNRHGIFFTHPREVISYHYERNPADPRITHALTLDADEYGNVRKSLAISYGRRLSPLAELRDRDKQTKTQITWTEAAFTNAIDDAVQYPGDYRTPLPAETSTYELTGFTPENNLARFSFDEWARNGCALAASAADLGYELTADNVAKQKRMIEDVRILYRKDDLTALLSLGVIEPFALLGESYKLALTPGLLARVFTRKQIGQPDEDLLPNPGPLLEGTGIDQGGYVAMDGNWWIPSGRRFYDPAASVVNPAQTAGQELATATQHFFLTRKLADPFGQTALADYDAHDLLVSRTSDALGNTTVAVSDYRVLQPQLVTDPNRNRTAVAFDALGMVVATAVMGKEGEDLGDLLEGFDADPTLSDLQGFVADPQAGAGSLLGKATTRIVYDVSRFYRALQAPVAATLARETHFHDPGGVNPKIQISLSYSDGFAREIQKKVQAEPGDAPQRQAPVPLATGDVRAGDLARDAQGKVVQANSPRRWVGSGRTVFNNKGKPVRQYEPFFSATHLYEPEPEMTETGVSPVLFYDPVERVIATLHPNHSYEKVVFDSWQQKTYDANDTVAAQGVETGDPRTDPDIGGYVRDYLATQPAWTTWYAQRIGGQMGSAELDAAQKASAHANTPTVAHLDALGRPFLTIAHNKYTRTGTVVEEKNATRLELDIEGNQREVIDAKDRVVMRYHYDMLGKRLHQASMESGERWMLIDVAGNPIRAWDSRRFLRRMTYDALRRPIGLHITENGVERLAERTDYGEGQGDTANHCTKVHQVLDGAGIVVSVAYDFKGNLLEGRRDLLPTYKQAVNWLQNPVANDGSFTSYTTYDALNRPLTATSPDGSVYRPTFNEANLLDKVEVSLRGAAVTSFVRNIEYDAKGQRKRIDYENGGSSTYTYDSLTFRLIQLTTTRPAGLNGLASQIFADPAVVQDLHYTIDPSGNITRVEDAALKTVFQGQTVDPAVRYTYDALYRLIEARGREHIGQAALAFAPMNDNYRDYPFLGNQAHPSDPQALRHYIERYEYDAVGNFDVVRHVANGGSWTRNYDYQEDSLTEPGARQSNRLTRTTVGNGLNHSETYSYTDAQGNDVHGCITAIDSKTMAWDFKDQLQRVDLGGGGTAFYVYDASGRRVRKVIELQNGPRQKDRIYLGGFEIYREFSGSGAAPALERESLHIVDDKQRIALVETEKIRNGTPINAPSPVQRYQLGNHLASASVELAEDGGLISYEEYHPYGTTAFQAGRNAAEVSLKRYRHAAKERDDESGFYYCAARYYAPWLGRWTAADPSGIGAGMSLFEYCFGNPIKFIDDDGRKPTSDQAGFRQIFTEKEKTDPSTAHASTLVQAFKDGRIGGTSARDRFLSILDLTGGRTPGPTTHFDTFTIREIGTAASATGVGDTGFRTALRDSLVDQNRTVDNHRESSDQIGHFLTAAHIGYYVTDGDNYLNRRSREIAAYKAEHPIRAFFSVEESVNIDMRADFAWASNMYLSAMIGHEMIADKAFSGWGLTSTLASPFMATSQDYANFESKRLDLIKIDDTKKGNSYQDLLLTWVGFRFGQDIANDKFSSKEEASRWLDMMLTPQDLKKVPKTDPFYAEAQELQGLLNQYAEIQKTIHPTTAPVTP